MSFVESENLRDTFSSETSVQPEIAPARPSYVPTGKRIFDVGVTMLLMPIALPLFLILYLIVRADGGPGLFGHTRVGKDGKPFVCWKLRSMCVDSDQRLQRHLDQNPDALSEWQDNRKLSLDPRITRIGRLIRRTSLDELPQFFNVLRGNMSLVGPRPVTDEELLRYGRYSRVYLSVKPGVTGLWQVSGRNRTTYARRIAMDSHYVANQSLLLDSAIVAKTVLVVLRATGR